MPIACSEHVEHATKHPDICQIPIDVIALILVDHLRSTIHPRALLFDASEEFAYFALRGLLEVNRVILSRRTEVTNLEDRLGGI